MARSLVQKADDESTKALLDRYTFYVIPRPNPDGSEAFFRVPLQEAPATTHALTTIAILKSTKTQPMISTATGSLR